MAAERTRRARPDQPPKESLGQRLATVATAVCALLMVMIFASAADTYLTVEGILPLPATAVYVVFAILYCVCLISWLRSHGRLIRMVQVIRGHAPETLALLALGLISIAWSFFPGAYENYYLILIFGFQFVVFVSALLLPVFKPIQLYWRHLLLVAFLTATATVVLDAVLPGIFSHAQARASGWIGEPNIAAFVLNMLAVSVVEYRRITVVNAIVIAALLIGVVCTLSRGGLVCMVVFLAYYAWTLEWRLNLRSAMFAAGTLLLGAAGLYYGMGYLLTTAPRLSGQTVGSRMEMFTLDRDMTADDSADARFELVTEAVALIKLAPVLGHGTAAAQRGPIGPHNMYLALWIDFGVAGIGLYLVFLIAGYRHFERRHFMPGQALIMVIALYSLFSHTVVERRSLFLVYGILLSVSWFQARRRQRVGQRSGGRSARSGGGARSEQTAAGRRDDASDPLARRRRPG